MPLVNPGGFCYYSISGEGKALTKKQETRKQDNEFSD